MTLPAIETSDLTKRYGEIIGVESLDLRVEAGEVFGFLGPNGAGKTTTIRMLLDLIRPTRGTARVCDCDTRLDGIEVRRRVGYLPGDLKLPRRGTGRSLLEHLGRLRQGAGHDAIDPLAERLGLSLDRPIHDLSKGNRQKIGVVAAFMHDPEVLILDEPASGLDPLRQHDIGRLIRERAEAGRTVLLSSHALDQVEHVADRVGILREGHMVAVESVEGLKDRAVRRIEIRLDHPAPLNGLGNVAGVSDLRQDGLLIRATVRGSMDPLIKELAQLPVHTLTSEEPELEEIFRSYYGSDDGS
jgi:ABC-2 type transport system ATP-binding protein